MDNLSEFEKDSIGELINIAMGAAADNLNQLTGCDVQLTVPKVDLLSLKEYKEKILSKEVTDKTDLISVSEEFTGHFSGNAVLIFHFENSLNLVKSLLQDFDDLDVNDFTDMEEEVLTEVGNILLNSCIATFANASNTQLETNIPKFSKGNIHYIIDEQRIFDQETQLILLAEIGFFVETQEISGHMVLTLTLPILRSILEDFYKASGIEYYSNAACS